MNKEQLLEWLEEHLEDAEKALAYARKTNDEEDECYFLGKRAAYQEIISEVEKQLS